MQTLSERLTALKPWVMGMAYRAELQECIDIAKNQETTEAASQPTLFAQSEGDTLKEEGMAQALMKQGLEVWSAGFDTALRDLALTGLPFTAEDVVDVAGLPHESVPNGNNQIGAKINAAAKKGMIRKTGEWRKSVRPSSHSRELREWVGVWEWRQGQRHVG